MKNWRPISLLGVDYKIASADIAAGSDPGFWRGRFGMTLGGSIITFFNKYATAVFKIYMFYAYFLGFRGSIEPCEPPLYPPRIANRIKRLLPKIISDSQKGFLKGRNISDNTRLVFDIIEALNENKKEGLLLLIDFEKAFDTLRWDFIDKALRFF